MQDFNLPNAICIKTDVTDYAAFKQAVMHAEEKFGPADCLINNAGFSMDGNFTEIAHQDHERIVDLNVFGVINGMKIVIPGMQQRKTGTIINISSLADRNARPNLAVYAGAKAAVKSLSESLPTESAKALSR